MTVKSWRIIKDKNSYDQAMSRFLELANSDICEGSEDLDEFELLSLLIGHYEENHYQIEKPDPIEAIKFRMDQMGLTQVDMRQYLGSASKVSEVLSGKRKLSLSMIRRLHDDLGIPADILIKESENIEWSPVTYGVEIFEIAFNDRCKIQTANSEFIENTNSGNAFKLKAKQVFFDVSSRFQVAPSQDVEYF